jgi:O-antigen ligase
MISKLNKGYQDSIFLTFILLSTLLPSFGAIDNNAIRWFALSLVSFTYLIYSIRSGQSRLVLSKNKILFISFVFFYLLLSVFISKNSIESIIVLYKIIILIVVFLISYNVFKKSDYSITICAVFSVSLFLESLVVLFQFFSSLEGLSGIASNPNISSSSILIKLPFIIYFIYQVKKKLNKFLLRLIEYLSIIGIIILGSRLGLFSLFIIYFFYFFWYKNHRLNQVFSIVVIFTFSFFINNSQTVNNFDLSSLRIEKLNNDESANQRLNFYKKAIDLSFNKPFTGYGLGSWKYESLPYDDDNNNNDILVPYYTHNDFLQILFELGIIGLAAYLFLLIILFKKILFLEDKLRGILIIIFIVFVINSLLNFPIHRSQEIIPFILIASMIFSYSKKTNESKGKLSFYILICLITPIMGLSFLEHNSLKVQGKLISDYNLGTFSLTINDINDINYLIPNLSANGVPVSTYISRYYFENKQYNKSLSLLNFSSKANYKDIMTQELLLKNYIFLGKNKLALDLLKELISIYPNNSAYNQLYFSLISDLKLND